jgi:hypothetical protein
MPDTEATGEASASQKPLKNALSEIHAGTGAVESRSSSSNAAWRAKIAG